MAYLITGGTGFVGAQLQSMLGDQPVVLTSRNAAKVRNRFPSAVAVEWDPSNQVPDFSDAPPITKVIHLMGESIAEGRWNADKKRRIRESRIDATERLVTALLKQDKLPEVFVSASAVGIYGDAGDQEVDESYPASTGFLADVCRDWENATQSLEDAGVRVVKIRIGIVLGENGGALGKLVPIFKWGIGGRLGSGSQYVPWIHIADLCRLFVWAVQHETVAGPVNGAAPQPETNATLTKELARVLRRPAFLPVPKFAVKLALGEFADSLFVSQRVIPKVALDNGFEFRFNDLRSALEDLIK